MYPTWGRVVGVANEEDRRPDGADNEVANLEGASLLFVGGAGARNCVTTAGIKRRYAHDGGLDSQFLSRQPPPARVSRRDHLHARQQPNVADPFTQGSDLAYFKTLALQPSILGQRRGCRNKDRSHCTKPDRSHEQNMAPDLFSSIDRSQRDGLLTAASEQLLR